MSEAATPEVLRTRLDQVFDIPGSALLKEAANPSLELLAAKINSNDLFLVGPKEAINEHMTTLEQADQMQIMQGKPPLHMLRLDIGSDLTQERSDLIAQGDPVDIKSANLLQLIAQYDADLAGQLLQPVARELLVARTLFEDGTVAVSVRPTQEVRSMIERLNTFAKSGLEPHQAQTYKDLAATLSAELITFQADEQAVILTTAARRAVERAQETRLKRWGFRALGAFCATVAASVAYFGTSVSSSNIKYENGLGVVATNEGTTFDNTEQLLEQPETTAAQRQEIIDTEVLQLQLDERTAVAMKPAEGNTLQEDMQQQLIHDTQEAIDSIKTNQTDEPVSAKIKSDIEDIAKHNIPGTNETNIIEGEILLEGSALVALIFGGYLAYCGSRRGGRRDLSLKIYKAGGLTPSDRTESAAVNSSQKLGARARADLRDDSVVVR